MLCDALKLQSCPLQTLRYDPPTPLSVCSMILGYGGTQTTGTCRHLMLTFSFHLLMSGYEIIFPQVPSVVLTEKMSRRRQKLNLETKRLDLGFVYLRGELWRPAIVSLGKWNHSSYMVFLESLFVDCISYRGPVGQCQTQKHVLWSEFAV